MNVNPAIVFGSIIASVYLIFGSVARVVIMLTTGTNLDALPFGGLAIGVFNLIAIALFRVKTPKV